MSHPDKRYRSEEISPPVSQARLPTSFEIKVTYNRGLYFEIRDNISRNFGVPIKHKPPIIVAK